MTDGSDPASPITPIQTRILSVDALRGFDMFWIIGGEQVAEALEKLGGGVVVSAIAFQLKHAEWEGFRFYDCIFPLFLFLVGVSIVLSIDRIVAKAGRTSALRRIATRGALLFVVGVFYYGGVSREWPNVQVSGVLPRIALCYFFAASLYVLLSRRGIVIATVLCLVGYWAVMTCMPFPDVSLAHPNVGKKISQADAKTPTELFSGVSKTVSGTFEEGRNFAHYVDCLWLPGKKRNLYYSNEGLLSTIPAVATTLLGIMAGWLITNIKWSEKQKVIGLIGAGAACVAVGLLWGMQFPIIKRIWTSSFCLVSGGCSAMLLGLFYLVVDVLQLRKWCVPFLWIGANALFAYLVANLIDFPAIAARFAGGDVQAFLDTRIAQGIGGLVLAIVGLALQLLLLKFLYQRKIFIRL